MRQTVEWQLVDGDCVALHLASGVRIEAIGGPGPTVHVGEVVVDLHQRIELTGSCPVVITNCELARFTDEVGDLIRGAAPGARLRSYGDAVSLVLEASEGRPCLSGFIGHGFFGSLSFNDLELALSALVQAYGQLRTIVAA